METDSYLTIGHAHTTRGLPCQDYASVGLLTDGGAFAIVADGCSSGGRTDVGSRIMTLATAQAIRAHWVTNRSTGSGSPITRIGVEQQLVMAASGRTLGLTTSDLLSTCQYAYVCDGGGYIHTTGDGVYAYVLRDGGIVMTRYEWADNMPYYPAYQEADLAQFIAIHGGDLAAIRLTAETWMLAGDELRQLRTGEYSLGEGIRGITRPLAVPDLEYVAVFSDGATQIEGLDWKDAVRQLLAFKTTAGEFAKRRMMRVVRDSLALGHGPIDDLSYAVIHFPKGDDS